MEKYQIDNEIYQGSQSIVYNGTSIQDGRRVIIKALRREALTPDSIEELKREFEITKSFENTPEIVNAYDIESFESSLAIVLEDFGAQSLSDLLTKTDFSIDETLQIGISVAHALERIHADHLMHKDINPNNIVYNPDTSTAKIIDFGIASKVERENSAAEINKLLGTLPYISPEQTGRMNRLVDYRTDLYSLGATLHELLAGGPPFKTSDPLEIIHCHIARQPPRLDKLNPEVPPLLADIVAKLLSKTAEARYQSARGVKADLERCLEQYQKNKRIDHFTLGSHDYSDRLILGQKLYGRSEEIERLFAGFQLVLNGESSLFLISGQSGVGKTALVNEVLRPMTEHKGFFISSKFDQFDRNTPYMAIVNAFSQLARQLLTQDDHQIRRWKTMLKEGLGRNGGIITETIPEMSLIMGPQAPVEKLPSTETKNRFNVVFQKFVSILATTDHPIVLFLDDLQWADMASLELIEQFITSDKKSSLYIIGAYRDNEVEKGHPLISLIDKVKELNLPVEEARLSPLREADVSHLISDTLSLPEEELKMLAGLVFEKTGGNPFHVGQLLESLHAEDLLVFNADELKWNWDLAAIEDYGFSDNVIDLLVPKIAKLSDECRKALKLASCIGTVFDTELLSRLPSLEEHHRGRALEEATKAGLVQRVPLVEPLMGARQKKPGKKSGYQYKFVHDRILQAIYTNISEQEKLNTHRHIGLLLLERLQQESEGQYLFQTVLHLNLARGLLEAGEERVRLAELNLRAGIQAKQSAANESALEYLQTGISVLGEHCWHAEYELALALHEEAAEAAHLSTDSPKAAALTKTIFQHAKNVLDRVKAVEVHIRSLFAADKNVELLNFGTAFLKELGIKIPQNPSKMSILIALVRAKKSLAGKSDDTLLNLPPISDSRILAAMRILSAMSLPAYASNRNLYAYFILTQVRLISEFGHSIYSSNTYCSYGLILCGKLGDVENGYRFGKLGLAVLEKYFDRSRVGRAKTLTNAFIFPWKEHLTTTGDELRHGYREAFDSGDFQYGSTAIGFYVVLITFGGYRNLGDFSEETRQYLRAVVNKEQRFWAHFIRLNLHWALNLSMDVPDPLVMDGQEISEREMLAEAIRENNGLGEWSVYVVKILAAVHFGQFERGIEPAERARAMRTYHVESGHPASAYAQLGEGIIYLRATANWSSAEGRKRRRLVSQILKYLEKMSSHGPMNYLYMVELLRAEIYRARGKHSLAAEFYERAVENAAKNRHTSGEALAGALAADFYLSQGNKTIARSYAENSRFAYMRWGARAKVKQLEQQFRSLLQKTQSPAINSLTSTTAKTTVYTGSLDFESVFKAAQGISKEIVLHKLAGTLIRTVVENAGADKGLLIMEEQGQLRIEAGCHYDNGAFINIDSAPLRESSEVCHAIVRLVARSRTPVVLGNATGVGDFQTDTYIKKFRPKSILCMPIIHSGLVAGVLYLENKQTEDVFTQERLQVLHVLSGQAAISIRNAKLYQELVASKELLQEALHKAEESDRIKTTFLSRTSHELRTPLNPIINIPEWINEGIATLKGAQCSNCEQEFFLEDTDNINEIDICPECGRVNAIIAKNVYTYERPIEGIKEKMETIKESGMRLLTIVDDILNFSNLQLGNTALQITEVNIDLLLKDVHLELNPFASNRGVSINLINDSVEPTALVDDEKIKQVLAILGKNAIQASSNESQIVIRADREEDHLLFSIQDFGKGIKAEDTALIFESFRQVKEGHTRDRGGTGLGLAIAKNIVDLHRGQIWVESELGKGSTFLVRLPLSDLGYSAES